jgi:hypothetical protein
MRAIWSGACLSLWLLCPNATAQYFTPSPSAAELHAPATRNYRELQKRLPAPLLSQKSWSIPILHSFGVMTHVRLAEAFLYPDTFAETDLDVIGTRYAEAFSMPPLFDASRPAFEWDGDPWPINVVGHGLLGSEFYTRMRICRHGPLESLAATAASAVVWDYAFEAGGVRPSGLDLIYTPLAGALLGEGRYWAWRGASSLSNPVWRTTLMVVFDPLGEFGRALGSPC